MGSLMDLGEIMNWADALSGFISGVLLMGGIMTFMFTDAFFPVTLTIITSGLICSMDTLCPYGRQPHIFSIIGGFITGFVADILTVPFGLTNWLFLVVFLMFVIKVGSRVIGKSWALKKAFKT